MKLVFVRHAEPDYEHNTLTEKGFREAKLLSLRTGKWKVDKIYCSPLGRAIDTATPTCRALTMEPVILDFLKEFDYPVESSLHPIGANITWDFTPEYLKCHPELFDVTCWHESEIPKSGDIESHYLEVCRRFDEEILAEYGFHRKEKYYSVGSPEDHTLVIFCHLGVMLAIISHLLNLSPEVLWHGFFVAPSSVSILNAENRDGDAAYFRSQTLGDTTHLFENNEPVSYYGYFTTPFQG